MNVTCDQIDKLVEEKGVDGEGGCGGVVVDDITFIPIRRCRL